MAGSARFAGWTAVAGMVIGLAITPFMAAVWVYEPGVVWRAHLLLERTVGPALQSWGALSFGGEGTPYEVYGKVFFLVYLLMLPIVRYVHNLHKTSTHSRWEARTWRVLWVALILAAMGDASSYWGVSLPGKIGESLWGGGFAIEILAMLVVLASTTVYGIVLIRQRVIPLWSSILITLILPLGIVTTSTITDYAPNAVVVPMSIVWAAVGIWALTDPSEPRSTDPLPW